MQSTWLHYFFHLLNNIAGKEMKLRLKFFCLIIALNICVPANANIMACGAIICLSNIPGSVPSQCQSYRQAYFIIQVWSPYYNAPATALARQEYLLTCSFLPSPNANMPSILAAINQKYGMMMYDPGT